MSALFGEGLGYVVEYANYGTVSVALTSILILCLALSWGRSGGIRHVPGPPSPSWIFGQIRHFPTSFFLLTLNEPGNMRQLLIPSTYGEYEFGWQKLYGPFYRLKGCFGVSPPPPHSLFSDRFAARPFDGLRSSISAAYFEQYTFHIRADTRGYILFVLRREKCYHGQSFVFSSSSDVYK